MCEERFDFDIFDYVLLEVLKDFITFILQINYESYYFI